MWHGVKVTRVEFHVVPDDDVKDHDFDKRCWCVPEIDTEQDNMWIHRDEMDRMEIFGEDEPSAAEMAPLPLDEE